MISLLLWFTVIHIVTHFNMYVHVYTYMQFEKDEDLITYIRTNTRRYHQMLCKAIDELMPAASVDLIRLATGRNDASTLDVRQADVVQFFRDRASGVQPSQPSGNPVLSQASQQQPHPPLMNNPNIPNPDANPAILVSSIMPKLIRRYDLYIIPQRYVYICVDRCVCVYICMPHIDVFVRDDSNCDECYSYICIITDHV